MSKSKTALPKYAGNYTNLGTMLDELQRFLRKHFHYTLAGTLLEDPWFTKGHRQTELVDAHRWNLLRHWLADSLDAYKKHGTVMWQETSWLRWEEKTMLLPGKTIIFPGPAKRRAPILRIEYVMDRGHFFVGVQVNTAMSERGQFAGLMRLVWTSSIPLELLALDEIDLFKRPKGLWPGPAKNPSYKWINK